MNGNFTVHKEGQEGTIQVARDTGKIVTSLDQRPDWAEGLTTALVQERISFYEKRLGSGSDDCKRIVAADAVEFTDLGWLGMHAEGGDELEVFADPVTRSEMVAKCLGINTETGEFTKGNVLAEREVSRENRGRTQSEIEALEDSVKQGFTGETARQEAERERQTARR